MIPLLLTAVAVALPSRFGLINVGGEGQLYMGAWAGLGRGASASRAFPRGSCCPSWRSSASWEEPPGPRSPGSCAAGKLVNETISTLLLNYVAPLIVSFFIFGPWRSAESSAYPQSAAFSDAARLPSFFNTRIHAGLFIALAVLVLYCVLMERTRWGVQMRAIGGNPEAA